jgi:hypothetical protein
MRASWSWSRIEDFPLLGLLCLGKIEFVGALALARALYP